MANEPADNERARMVINLMDYIAKDYGMAVKDAQVINDFEYAEMKEFSWTALETYNALNRDGIIDSASSIGMDISTVATLIGKKGPVDIVAARAHEAKEKLLALNLIPVAPTEWPDLGSGQKLYIAHCSTCHGVEGNGDGPAGQALEPLPTVFTDRDIMDGVAPLQAFNTTRLGIEGTGMRAFMELNDQEVWDLSFYILSLRYAGDSPKDIVHFMPSLEQLATLSDNGLLAMDSTIDVVTARLKPHALSEAVEVTDPIHIARSLLEQSLSTYQLGDQSQALNLALRAYLEGVEPIEAQVMASDNRLFNDLEGSMMAVRAAIQASEAPEVVESKVNTAIVHIDEAATLLQQEDRGTVVTALIAGSILLREGLEAFFIILAVLGILQSVNAPRAARWVHSGWITAVIMGLVGWFFADSLMNWNAKSRELMEGLIALFAVIVLLYLGFWLHGKTEASKWKEFVETRIKKLLNSNNMLGLAAFSFVVVFREAFESVIFLSSLTVDGRAESKMGVFIGFMASAIVLFAIAWAMLRLFKRLPIHKVFLYSSMVVLALAFILAGDGIHAIQEGGYLGIHPFPINIKVGFLGIYPTYETILTQVAVLVGIGVLWKVSSHKVRYK